MRAVDSGQIQALVGGVCGPDLIAFETKHPRKQVRHADIVVNDEYAWCGGAAVRRGHRVIVEPGRKPVK
jgi:hypothetical protein